MNKENFEIHLWFNNVIQIVDWIKCTFKWIKVKDKNNLVDVISNDLSVSFLLKTH